jgi:hypothetical protein
LLCFELSVARSVDGEDRQPQQALKEFCQNSG